MTQIHKQLIFDASMKVLIAVLSAASLFAIAFFWAATSGETDLIREAESGFNLSALKLVILAAAFFLVIAALASFGEDHDGRRKHRAISLALEYIDDVGGVLASAGGVAIFMAFNRKGAEFGWWGISLLCVAFGIKYLCAYGLQRVSLAPVVQPPA